MTLPTLINHTRLQADVFAGRRFWQAAEHTGAWFCTVVVKATYTWNDKGVCALAEEQMPILRSDVLNPSPDAPDTPDTLANRMHPDVQLEHDLVPVKTSFEVLLAGTLTLASPATKIACELRVGSAIRKAAWVHGARTVHNNRFGMTSLGAPEPFSILPLSYRFAYGGHDPNNPARYYAHNPIGCGEYSSNKTPQMEHPTNPKTPIGFGPIGRYWQARVHAAAIADSKPDEPSGNTHGQIDPRFFNCAPVDQQLPSGYPESSHVRLRGMTPTMDETFTLPPATDLEPNHVTFYDSLGRSHKAPVTFDTLCVFPHERTFTLTGRSTYCAGALPSSVLVAGQ
jgi:hypothetical protein